MPYVSELWVYPIKACRGTKVPECEMVESGFALDRQWCVVDMEGKRYPEREFLSQRKMRALATVAVEIAGDELIIGADGMGELKVPVPEDAYKGNADVEVNCGGHSTTDPENQSWNLGKMVSKHCGAEAQKWFTEYLNRVDVDKKRRPETTYALVRMTKEATRSVATYAGPTATLKNGLPGAKMDGFNTRAGDGAAFHDFAPFLLTSQASVDWIGRKMKTNHYPVEPFRGSIVVDGCEPWDEEEWLEFKIGPYYFRKLKECPRCSVPARDQKTGEFIFKDGTYKGVKGSKLQVSATLREQFPEKAEDDEWGTWKGPFMGVYVGHDAQTGAMSSGMEVTVLRRREKKQSSLCMYGAPLAAVSAVAAYLLYSRRQ